MTRIPPEFEDAVRRHLGIDGARRVERLPEVIDELLSRWDLREDGGVLHGGLGLVVPVRRGNQPYVLKLCCERSDAAEQALAYKAWNGRGAAYMLEADIEAGGLLIERLDNTRSPRSLPLLRSLEVAGLLLNRLAIPAPASACRLADRVARFDENATVAVPRRTVERAREIGNELAPGAEDLLVHYDLHDDNIIGGEREEWLAVDPKVVAGDREFGAAQLFWRRLEEMGSAAQLEHCLDLLAETAELDVPKLKRWTYFRTVDYWMWGLAHGLTEDPLRCEMLTSWLDEIG